ncbi:MAG: hypothetical protein WC581_04510 [Thermodesulfovibrionales bacterium]
MKLRNIIKNIVKKEETDMSSDWTKAKCFVIIAFTCVLVYKIALTPLNLTVDFPTLLSLLLAFFSVVLAALFYFKATESSNAFYDNTYKFTQDIASLLVKIESGFGERLRHLDEGYTSMRDKIATIPRHSEIENTKTEIIKEEQEVHKKLEEKDKLVEELAKKAQLDDKEKQIFKSKLDKYIEELNEAQKEVAFLKNRLRRAEFHHSTQRQRNGLPIDRGMADYIVSNFFSYIPVELIIEGSKTALNKRFQHIKNELPDGFIHDMKKYNMLSPQGTLTGDGVMILREIADTYKRQA